MNAVVAIEREFTRLGYAPAALIRNYTFADFLAEQSIDRRIPLAAFTQTPSSYRNAAAGVIAADGRAIAALLDDYRALGAPLLFVIEGDLIGVWQVRTSGPPRQLARVRASDVPSLFSHYEEQWRPATVHRAKSIGIVEPTYQLDFIDVGLLPVIEGQVHRKLDRLLKEVLELLQTSAAVRPPERYLFRVIFRLLAAKILRDRNHKVAVGWDENDVEQVLNAIAAYYGLDPLTDTHSKFRQEGVRHAWRQLRQSVSFSNISADDLAYVYENTLVTPDVRRELGTHSTPRPIAEYIVSRLEFWKHDPASLNVYEPFVGAGVFLISSLRHLRDLLPAEWNDRRRHDFLVQRLRGDDVDSFAVEVAKLSLILADYPNANGWQVNEVDLFEQQHLSWRMKAANVILCNPPFEQFSQADRSRYAVAHGSGTYTKALAVLKAALDARPLAIGFVLPEPVLLGTQYLEERRRLEADYRHIELVRLPDRVFTASVVRSGLLIATERRDASITAVSRIRSTVVKDIDREKFLESGHVSSTRVEVRQSVEEPTGELWLGDLQELWKYLREHRRLGELVTAHRGLEWNYPQRDALSSQRRPGYSRGLFSANSIQQFVAARQHWIDVRPESAKYLAYKLPWRTPKILVNAARLSRGPWCAAAVSDETGLVASQQFFGMWPREGVLVDLDVLTALINSPVGNAFLDTHSLPDRIRKHTLEGLPIPSQMPQNVGQLVRRYVAHVRDSNTLPHSSEALQLLMEIDAAVLSAYGLPPRLEQELLEYFRGAERPVSHGWHHWLPEGLTAAVPLGEFLSTKYSQITGHWILKVFTPVPDEDLREFRELGD